MTNESDVLKVWQELQDKRLNCKTLWLHYKGDKYVIMGRCLREHDLEPCVIYRNLYSSVSFCRPASEWTEKVEVQPGVFVQRFEPIPHPLDRSFGE